jgi:hypothetical protein
VQPKKRSSASLVSDHYAISTPPSAARRLLARALHSHYLTFSDRPRTPFQLQLAVAFHINIWWRREAFKPGLCLSLWTCFDSTPTLCATSSGASELGIRRSA